MRRFLLLMSASLAACATTDAPVNTAQSPTSMQAASAGKPSSRAARELADVMDRHWDLVLKESPVFATTTGVRDYDDQLGDMSLTSYEAGVAARQDLLADLMKVDRAKLTGDDVLNYDLLKGLLEGDIAEAAAPGNKFLLINTYYSPLQFLTGLPEQLPFRNEADYRSYLARLTQVSQYLGQTTDRLRTGIGQDWVQPCAPMEGYENSINAHVVIDPEDSVFLDPFDRKPASIDEAIFAAMKAEAAATIRSQIVPAIRSFETFYNLEYQPSCREEVGVSTMPGGAAYYENRVAHFTTTDLTSDEIHEIGLGEVARIRAEMEEIAKGEGFADLAAFQRYLRTTPNFYPVSPKDRMKEAALIAKKMDGQLVKLFTKLPKMPYDVKEIPLDIAPKTTTAYYNPPAGDGSRAGSYFINTTKLEQRPNYELESLTFHEAVPGHHLQIAIQQELDIAEFRKYLELTAFVEGWALYSERLGLEVGFYDTPYTNFGRLSYEMWRACRLVVDTGMHMKGWTRQEAIDYMADNSGLSLANITNEVDRYITWPGQALGYKIGELKIRELRARAEAELGAKFDVRLFHDEVLEAGAIPLSVLEERIDAWIAEQKVAG